MSSPLQNNITNLQSVLEAVNALPEEVTLPELTNPGDASKALSGYEFINGDGEKVTGTIETKTASNLTASGATVKVPAGYYASQATKSVATTTQATPSVSIDSAGKITATATQSAGYVASGSKSGTKQLTTQAAKTITPSTSSQTAVASGVYTTGDVTVAAVPTQTKSVTPTSSSQDVTADSGKFLSKVTVSGDENLTAENIKSGVSIFGVDGTLSGGFPNGTEWTTSPTTIKDDLFLDSVYYANGIWVAGTSAGNAYQNGLYYSTDGKTWTLSNINQYFTAKNIYYANGIWFAYCYDSTSSNLYYSIDGMIWTKSLSVSGLIYAMHNANGIWIISGPNSFGSYYSTDGKTWTQYSTTPGDYFCSIYNANGIWVASCGNSGLYYSTDGITWTQSNITSGTFYSRCYNANGIWITSNNSGLYYSTDGKIWTQSNITSGTIYSVYNANGIWVAGGTSGLYYSTDGITWTQSNITSGTIYSVYNANGIWVAGGRNGNSALLYYSVSWEPTT